MDIEQDTIRYIPLNKLFPSTHNARKTKRAEGIPELAASILAHGLRQNLNVVERRDGKYEVNAGGRRLAALKLLAKDGKIAKDFAVPCKLTAEDAAQEISLAENIQRIAMDVMDEVEAFAVLNETGLSTDDIARRFGATLRHVEQRLALARLSPKLRNAYRKGDLSLEAARAFCLAPNQETQERLFKQMAKPITHAPSVRRALTQGRIDSNDRIAKFVGLEIYEQAGGQLRRDLFDESCILIEDGALIGMGILIGRWGAQPAVPGATTASASAAARQAPASANPPTTLAQAATAPTSAPESAALMRAAEALQQLHTQASAPTPHASATVTAAHVSASAAKPAARRAPPKAPPAPAPTPVAAPAPVAEPPPPAPAPVVAARPAAPRELCAGTQFLARGLCLQTECNKPGQQKHPQCAQLREQQEAMRQGTGGG